MFKGAYWCLLQCTLIEKVKRNKSRAQSQNIQGDFSSSNESFKGENLLGELFIFKLVDFMFNNYTA